jgi:predicted metal-dependent HD superfamily phosphohydrolase
MDRDTLAAAWRYLLAGRPEARGDVTGTGDRLLDRWSEPHRGYHDLAHLAAVLAHLTALGEHPFDPDAVRLAAWYHDAVYAGRPDDEERSAALAERELGRAGLALEPTLVAEVARLVRGTATHDPAPGDRNGEALCDADLAVLAGDPGTYAAYVAGVRDEYAAVPDPAFRAGRARLLRALLDSPTLFRTPYGQQVWEAPARANVERELRELEPRPGQPGGNAGDEEGT